MLVRVRSGRNERKGEEWLCETVRAEHTAGMGPLLLGITLSSQWTGACGVDEEMETWAPPSRRFQQSGRKAEISNKE